MAACSPRRTSRRAAPPAIPPIIQWRGVRRTGCRRSSIRTRRPAPGGGGRSKAGSGSKRRRGRKSPAGPRSRATATSAGNTRRGGWKRLTGVPAHQVRAVGPPPLGSAPGRVLRVVRGRAALQRDPDRPGDFASLCAHREPRAAGRQRPVRGGAGERRLGRRASGAVGPHPRRGRTPPRAAPERVVHLAGLLPGGAGARALPGARPRLLRLEPPRLARGGRTRRRGPRTARLLRPCRPLPQPDRALRGPGAAGQLGVGARGAPGRVRDYPGGERPRPASPARRRVAGRVP